MPKKIILIDDDADDRMVFCNMLQDIDPEIICMAEGNGSEVIEHINSADFLPDLIFIDINMPQKNGWHYLIQIKGNHATVNIPVIMYSTSSDKMDAKRATEMGALVLLTKPDNIAALRNMLYTILMRMDEGKLNEKEFSQYQWQWHGESSKNVGDYVNPNI